MPQKRIDLIGASLGVGAGHFETAFGPQVLYEKILQQILEQKTDITWQYIPPPLQSEGFHKKQSYHEKLKIISEFNDDLANRVEESIHQNAFPMVIGGDHTIAVGTWSGIVSALNAHEQFGLIWFDAHMDSHTPDTTPSGNIHGMPLAALLGYGSPALVKLASAKVKLNPKHVVLIGVRSYEAEEAALLRELNVKIYLIEEVKQRGLATIFEEAVQKVTLGTKGFGISLDIDVFDPSIAMGTGTPAENGLEKAEEVCAILQRAAKHPLYKGLEITEFNPAKDQHEQTLNLMKKLVLSAMEQ